MGRLRHRARRGGRLSRWLARQFARPHGLAGRFLIAPWLDRISRSMNRLVLRELRIGAGEDVLEVGFGGGGLLAAMREGTRGRVIGADPSGAAVERARRRFGDAVEVHLAAVEALPLAAASVDKAASVNNIYFWSEPDAAAAELARVLRPGGLVAIAFEPPEELRKWPGHRHGFRLWSEEQVRGLMAAAGFERIGAAWGTGRKPDRFLCLTGTRRGAEAD